MRRGAEEESRGAGGARGTEASSRPRACQRQHEQERPAGAWCLPVVLAGGVQCAVWCGANGKERTAAACPAHGTSALHLGCRPSCLPAARARRGYM